MKKSFNINTEISSVLESLVGNDIVGLYAPQYIIRQNKDSKDSIFLGKDIYISLSSKQVLVLAQYTLNDIAFINQNNNLKLSVQHLSMIDLNPHMLEQGVYYDFVDSRIFKVELYGYLNFQSDSNQDSEIIIKDKLGDNHYFIDIKCSYILRLFMKNQQLNILLDNERFFSGANDFVSRFKIVDDIECDRILSFEESNGDEYSFGYKKILSL